MTNYINTVEDFLKVREHIQPVYINSKKRGKVLVPCANTILVNTALILANTWNPNHIPADKMNLLEKSIILNGFCFPVVTIWDDDLNSFVIIDGFHRSTIGGKEWLDFDYIPIVFLTHDISQRMIATMQFNKAKGMHAVDLDAELIRKLLEGGLSEEQVSEKLEIEIDTVHRYKQLTGIHTLFSKTPYSTSWEMQESDNQK